MFKYLVSSKSIWQCDEDQVRKISTLEFSIKLTAIMIREIKINVFGFESFKEYFYLKGF